MCDYVIVPVDKMADTQGHVATTTPGPKHCKHISKETRAIVRTLKFLEASLSTNLESSAGKHKYGKPPEALKAVKRPQPVRTESVNVFVRVVFLKLGEVDTINEKFMADVFMQAKWSEPALDKTDMSAECEVNDWTAYWNPKLYLENGLGEPKETIWYTVGYSPTGKATVYQKRRIKGIFFEKMELMEYPFDTQDLTVMVTSERSEQEVALIADPVEVSSVNVQSFVDEQEWRLHHHVNTWTRAMTQSDIYQNSRLNHPAFAVSCQVTRRVEFFMWNVFVIMIFISSLVFTTWIVEAEKTQSRLQLSFILLLSNITFKFSVSQSLPKVSYLTLLDKYVLLSGLQLCLVWVWHVIMSNLLHDKQLSDTADKIALFCQGAGYVIFNVAFFAHGRYIIHKRVAEFTKKDRRQQAKLKAMEEILASRGQKK